MRVCVLLCCGRCEGGGPWQQEECFACKAPPNFHVFIKHGMFESKNIYYNITKDFSFFGKLTKVLQRMKKCLHFSQTKLSSVKLHFPMCTGYCLCRPEALISLVQETGANVIPWKVYIWWGNQMDELDVSLEMRKILEDTLPWQWVYEVLCSELCIKLYLFYVYLI